MNQEKLFKDALKVSGLVSPILLLVYYQFIYVGMLETSSSLLGYGPWIELVLVFILFYACTLPLAAMGLYKFDFHAQRLGYGYWLEITVVGKTKHWARPAVTKISGYNYTFNLRTDGGEILELYGTSDAYEALSDGCQARVLIYGAWIRAYEVGKKQG